MAIKKYSMLTGTLSEGTIFGCVYHKCEASRVTLENAPKTSTRQFVHVDLEVMY